LSSLAPPSSGWLKNVLKIVAGELNMLEILVVLARRNVERRTAAATALQATFVSTNVDHNAKTSKIIANYVEWQVQLHVQYVLPGNVMLMQVRPGSGGCQGLPSYKVGARFIVHDKHGSLPLGAILKSEIPPGTAHISEKPT
jgi:hypothetical protein